ncbi:MAG: LIC_13355 family lipoprotein [Leptospiraceae bacterium]|nr:LIC_13355 family lipoprotein [Leptospiraceae bacterium]MCK6380211.1 LIC_13355 family lipoprotein [Leptospiraceae bacterium]NUM41321.1 LIC_13355 family lipoprotein [Leptospiraceae bacterium]
MQLQPTLGLNWTEWLRKMQTMQLNFRVLQLFKRVIILAIFLLFNCTPEKSSAKTNSAILLLAILGGSMNSVALPPEDAADNVVSAPNHTGDGFYDKNKAINGVRGSGCCSGSTDVYSLSATGIGASIVLEWKNKKIVNGAGIDLIVFENPFNINGNSSARFMEPLIVEVSRDNIKYCGFFPNYTHTNETVYSNDPSKWLNFAGKTPVLYNEDTNKIAGNDIYDLSKSGGDGFDLDNLSSDNSFSIGCSTTVVNDILQNGFYYIRLTSATDRVNPDSGVKFPKDSGAFDGSDIDGVFARYRSLR